MSLWPLLGVGLVGLVTLSVLVGLSVGAILGHISREISDLLDSEPWPPDATVATISRVEQLGKAAVGSCRSLRPELSLRPAATAQRHARELHLQAARTTASAHPTGGR